MLDTNTHYNLILNNDNKRQLNTNILQFAELPKPPNIMKTQDIKQTAVFFIVVAIVIVALQLSGANFK